MKRWESHNPFDEVTFSDTYTHTHIEIETSCIQKVDKQKISFLTMIRMNHQVRFAKYVRTEIVVYLDMYDPYKRCNFETFGRILKMHICYAKYLLFLVSFLQHF